MIKIETYPVGGRVDWYHARAVVKGKTYSSFMATRRDAFMAVLGQLYMRAIVSY